MAIMCTNTFLAQHQVGDAGEAGGIVIYIDEVDEFDWDYIEASQTVLSSWQRGPSLVNLEDDIDFLYPTETTSLGLWELRERG